MAMLPRFQTEYLWKEERIHIYHQVQAPKPSKKKECLLHCRIPPTDVEALLQGLESFLIPNIEDFTQRLTAAVCNCEKADKKCKLPEKLKTPYGSNLAFSERNEMLLETVAFFRNVNNYFVSLPVTPKNSCVIEIWQKFQPILSTLANFAEQEDHHAFICLQILRYYFLKPVQNWFSVCLPMNKYSIFFSEVPFKQISNKFHCEINLDVNEQNVKDGLVGFYVKSAFIEDFMRVRKEIEAWASIVRQMNYIFKHCNDLKDALSNKINSGQNEEDFVPEKRTPGISIVDETKKRLEEELKKKLEEQKKAESKPTNENAVQNAENNSDCSNENTVASDWLELDVNLALPFPNTDQEICKSQSADQEKLEDKNNNDNLEKADANVASFSLETTESFIAVEHIVETQAIHESVDENHKLYDTAQDDKSNTDKAQYETDKSSQEAVSSQNKQDLISQSNKLEEDIVKLKLEIYHQLLTPQEYIK